MMVKKKEILGSSISIEVPVKEKKVISDKQRDNLKKGMMALKAKREGLRAEQEEESSHVAQPVAPPVAQPPSAAAPVAEVKSKRTYTKQPKKESVGLEEFNNFKNELLGKLQPREVVKEVSVEKIVDRPIITEKVVEKERFISSSELLNKIFFS